jgi:hypothetical protein
MEVKQQQQQQQLARDSGGWELAYVYIDNIDSSLIPRSSSKHAADKLEGDHDDDIFGLEL